MCWCLSCKAESSVYLRRECPFEVYIGARIARHRSITAQRAVSFVLLYVFSKGMRLVDTVHRQYIMWYDQSGFLAYHFLARLLFLDTVVVLIWASDGT